MYKLLGQVLVIDLLGRGRVLLRGRCGGGRQALPLRHELLLQDPFVLFPVAFHAIQLGFEGLVHVEHLVLEPVLVVIVLQSLRLLVDILHRILVLALAKRGGDDILVTAAAAGEGGLHRLPQLLVRYGEVQLQSIFIQCLL